MDEAAFAELDQLEAQYANSSQAKSSGDTLDKGKVGEGLEEGIEAAKVGVLLWSKESSDTVVARQDGIAGEKGAGGRCWEWRVVTEEAKAR